VPAVYPELAGQNRWLYSFLEEHIKSGRRTDWHENDLVAAALAVHEAALAGLAVAGNVGAPHASQRGVIGHRSHNYTAAIAAVAAVGSAMVNVLFAAEAAAACRTTQAWARSGPIQLGWD